MSLKSLLLTAAIPTSAILGASPAFAQAPCPTEISTAETRQVRTSSEDNGAACDVTIAAAGSVETSTGSAVIIDSSNLLTVAGTITSTDSSNTTGVEIQGGNTGGYTQTGQINLTETVDTSDTDGDGTPDNALASGTGRTGILISGNSPFVGDITTEAGSGITVAGNDSYAFRLMETAGLTGNINLAGNITVTGGIPRDTDGNATGGASAGVLIEGNVDGDVYSDATIGVQGEGARGMVIAGDVTGGLTLDRNITSTGYRFNSRATYLAFGEAIDETDTLQAGSALQVSGNIAEGVHLRREFVTETDSEGVETTTQVGDSRIIQVGNAPAILFHGQGTQISIGTIVPVSNTDSPELHFAFVNQGTVTSDGLIDDIGSTAMWVEDTTLEGGISNQGSMTAQSFTSTASTDPTASQARVIVLGNNAIAEQIQNTGLIQAVAQENTSELYADIENPLTGPELLAIGIDVEGNATLTNIVNTGTLSAAVVGQNGTAIAIRDNTGSIAVIDNTGTIQATGNLDSNLAPFLENVSTSYTTIAMDLSANTTGVTINQTAALDTDPDDGVTPNDPSISGDIYLGDGDDLVNLAAGTINGDISFAGGSNTLALSGGSTYVGTITNSGSLVISAVDGSTVTQNTATAINATSATFDGNSVFRPTIDGASGLASTLNTTGDITFTSGSVISPILTSVIDPNSSTFTVLNAAGSLNLDSDLVSLLSFDTPFMYDTVFSIDPTNPNALLITLGLRSTEAMGLDAVQTASFATNFEALSANPALASAFVNITDGDQFRSALNQLLPEFAAAPRHFVVANVDGAVGAVGTHLDNARNSQGNPGGAWIQEFTYFADRDLAGLSEQFRGFGFGFTGGLDTELGPFHAAGVNFGFASTEIEDVLGVDDPLDVVTFQAGLYAGYETGDFSLDMYGGGGYNTFDQKRNVQIGTFSESVQSEWSGTHVNASLRAGYDIELSKKYWLRPAFSMDYLRVKEDAYTENSAIGTSAIALDVDGRTSEMAGATAMLNFGANYQGRRTWVRPAIRVGYRNEFINDGIVTNYGFAGLAERASITSEVFPEDGFLIGFTVAAGSDYSSVGFDFDSDIRDGFIRHTGRIVLRMIF